MAVAAFLSYAHQDRELAGGLKRELAEYGVDCFLAHEDIKPSVQWQDEILRQLQACDVFLALLTDAFDASDWTHQEIGIAHARGPIMVPINAGRNPVGFLARYQAIRLDATRVKEACFRIVLSIAHQNDRLAEEMRAVLIRRMAEALTFDEAGQTASKLLDLGNLTASEINALLDAATQNRQVYESGRASRSLRELIRRHRRLINKNVLNKFYKVWAYAPS
ncbi:MAG: toll/interleukin-1 receptor domain-containing protein [bacterium]